MGNNKPQDRTVREGKFNRTLDAMNYEMAQKTAKSMAIFHEKYVTPLERRLMTIETVTGIRLMRWIRWELFGLWQRLYMRFTEAVPQEEGEPTVAAPVLETVPEPEHDGVSRIALLGDD